MSSAAAYESEQSGEYIPPVLLRHIVFDDWEKLKHLRLNALQKNPRAFSVAYQEEAGRTDEEWQDKITETQGDDANHVLITGENEIGELVAMAGAYEIDDGIWRLNSVYVDPDYRKNKLGKRLLIDTISALEQKGATKIELIVNIKEEAAVELYRSLGFSTHHVEWNKKSGDGNMYNKYFMEKTFNQNPPLPSPLT